MKIKEKLFFSFVYLQMTLLLFLMLGCGNGENGIHYCTSQSGACYYVNEIDGNDSNTGTSQTSPWKTLAKVNSETFDPGDQILLKKGCMWREILEPGSSGTNAMPIVFDAYGAGPAPIINGAEIITGWTQVGSSNIYSKDLSSWSEGTGVVIEDGSPLNFVQWDTNYATTSSNMSSGTFTTDNTNKIVYIWTTDTNAPSNHSIEISRRQKCINITNKTYLTIKNITVQNASLHAIFVESGVNIDFSEMIIRNSGGLYFPAADFYAGNGIEWTKDSEDCSLTNSEIYGIFDTGASPQLYNNNVTITNITISNNTFYNNGMDGVEISIHGLSTGGANNNTHQDDITVSKNTIYNTGAGWSGNRNGSGVHI